MSIGILLPSSTRRQGRIGAIALDATISETHSATSQVTTQPVEEGANISDHIINDPLEVEITGFITNSPVLTSSTNFRDAAQAAFDELFFIREQKQLVVVVTYYKVYDNMAITSINIPRTLRVGQAINFTIRMRSVNKVGRSALDLLAGDLTSLTGPAREARERLNLGRANVRNVSDRAANQARNVISNISTGGGFL